MLTKTIRKAFGTFNIINSLKNIKSVLRAPIKHIKSNFEPSGSNYSTQTNTTEEGFDEVSQEWQTVVASNPFDLQTFNYLENAQLMNFGTVDNPLVIFTADAPFRYVGCSGPQNEDDYEGHELMWIMLREGPLQRCGICGQVFKLVRLRNENSEQMNYYLPNFHTYEYQDMGEHDILTLLSIHKANTHFEYTHHETPDDSVYSMVNPDDHDRILTDPAYRMQKIALVEEKAKVYMTAMNKIEDEIQNDPRYREPISKVDYENMIEVEAAIKKLDRNFRKVTKFESRKFVDPDNHERREKRMLERAKKRWEGAYTLYTGTLTEEEQKYRDYFETDLENYREDERIEEYLDRQEILSDPRYNLNRYDFQETYINGVEDDQSSYLEKKIFKYKYRRALDSAEDYERRSRRVAQNQRKRFVEQNVNQLIQNYLADPTKYEKDYLRFVKKESVSIYRDYFESDKDENIELLETVDNSAFSTIFENFQIAKQDRSTFKTFKNPEWNPALGWWANTLTLWQEVTEVIPRAQEAGNRAVTESLVSKEEQQRLNEQKHISGGDKQ